MGSLRGRLRKLELEAEGETVAVRCSECGERFVVGWDTGLEYLAWEWRQGYEGETYGETAADVLRVVAHEHDSGAFVLQDGTRWLDEFKPGAPA